MREIKFRAWDVCEKCMLNEKGDSVRFNNANSLFTVRQPFVRFDRGDIILMQYTGLKDKNGKEIYEGDILRGALQVGYVRFDDGHFIIQYGLDSNFIASINKFEVIGNIYENEGLLK